MKKRKASLSFIITILVVGLVTLFLLWSTFFFLSLYVSSMKQAAQTSSEQAVTQASNAISNYIGDMQEIMSLIEKNLTKSGEKSDQTLETLCNVRSDLVAVYIYDARGQLADSYTGTHTMKEHYLKDLSYIALDSYSQGILYLSEPHVESLLQDYYPWVVSVLQELTGADGQRMRVVIDIRFSKISDYVDNVGIGQHGYCFITDSNGEIIYHPQQQLLYSGLKKEATAGLDLSSNGSFETDDLICSVRSLDNCDWKVVGVSYISELVTAKEMELLGNICVMLTIILLVTMLVSFLVSRLVTNPVQRLIRAMGEFEKDAAGYVYRPVEGTMEIEALSQSYEHMVRKIQKLMNQVRQEEISLRKTELKALQAQINPHFLYNVLDTINWMARKKGEENICRMVTAISNLMRASISNKRSMVRVKEELKYIEDYLFIQETRYGDKFTSYIEVDEELNELEIPKMVIQTLVENAVVHGVENATWDCFLYISGEIQDDMAVFKVKDDGVGISAEKLEALLKMEEEPEHKAERTHTNLGIYAVQKRLEYVYHGKAKMTITSEKGTLVVLEIPLKKAKEIMKDGTSGNDIG